jgi:hypothetical protein
MFMTQNASVEAVAARTYKTERKDFILRFRRGDSGGKECASGEGQGLEGSGYRSPSALEDSEKAGDAEGSLWRKRLL